MSTGTRVAPATGQRHRDELGLERELLTGLATLAQAQDAGDQRHWARFRSRLAAVDVTADARAAEHRLETASERLRTLLLRRGHRLDEEHFRSPDSTGDRRLPSGLAFPHSYERGLPVAHLENRLAAGPVPDGWHKTVVTFNSCMAGLGHVFQSLVHMLSPDQRRPLSVAYWGDYFETDLLLEYLGSAVLRYDKVDTAGLTQCLRRGGHEVLLIEPVRYNWELDVLDVTALLRAWRAAAARPRIIVVDTTLVSPLWPTRAVLAGLAGLGDVLVVELRSGLKLDQQGLELANLGIAEIYSPAGPAPSAVPSHQQLAETMRLARATTGAGIPVAAAAALDVGFIADPAWTRRHAGQVYANNARLARELESVRGVFAEVVHPALGAATPGVAQSPFVIVKLTEDTLHNHGLLLAALRREVARRGIRCTHGSSFGFRSHRFETIVPRVARREGLFKIASGSRSGPFLDTLIEVLRDLGGLPDMAALHARYPDLKAIPLI
ncbi:hypothetical protein AB0C12_33490 [Actinoplanes sp. NPDC048967]|uniref:hypothetical protein n=1 Tax=Actinoplanes sp. NPDC048967 TaxID=3155269 RepID=UPI0034032B93